MHNSKKILKLYVCPGGGCDFVKYLYWVSNQIVVTCNVTEIWPGQEKGGKWLSG